jgi:hypothetical protein
MEKHKDTKANRIQKQKKRSRIPSWGLGLIIEGKQKEVGRIVRIPRHVEQSHSAQSKSSRNMFLTPDYDDILKIAKKENRNKHGRRW